MDSQFDKNARHHTLKCTTAVIPEALDILGHQALVVPKVNLVSVMVFLVPELKVKRDPRGILDHQVFPVLGVRKVILAAVVMALVRELKVTAVHLGTPDHQVRKGHRDLQVLQDHQVSLAMVYQGHKLVGIQTYAKHIFFPHNNIVKCMTYRNKGTEG